MNDFDICIGIITAINGVKGYVKIKSFTESPEHVCQFDKVFDEEGNTYDISMISQKRDFLIASIANVDNKTKSQQLVNKHLYIKRSSLPDTAEEEYYHADLINLEARSEDGVTFGVIRDILNFGAGDVIEVHDFGLDKSVFYPFSKQFVPEINVTERFVTFLPLEEVLASEEEEL